MADDADTDGLKLRLVHSPRDCDDCFEYALHVEATLEEEGLLRLQHSPSFADEATSGPSRTVSAASPPAGRVSASKTGHEDAFQEGIELGRSMQRKEDEEVLEQYQVRMEEMERDAEEQAQQHPQQPTQPTQTTQPTHLQAGRAVPSTHVISATDDRIAALEFELALARDMLLAAQMAYDDLAQAHATVRSGGTTCARCDAGINSSGWDVDEGATSTSATTIPGSAYMNTRDTTSVSRDTSTAGDASMSAPTASSYSFPRTSASQSSSTSSSSLSPPAPTSAPALATAAQHQSTISQSDVPAFHVPVDVPAGDDDDVWEDLNDFPDIKARHAARMTLKGWQDRDRDGHENDDEGGHGIFQYPDEDEFILEQLQALGPEELDAFWADYTQEHDRCVLFSCHWSQLAFCIVLNV